MSLGRMEADDLIGTDSSVSNLLVCLPPSDPARDDLCNSLLVPDDADAVGTVAVTFRQSPDQWLDEPRHVDKTTLAHQWIISVGEQARSTAQSSSTDGHTLSTDPRVTIETVASPGNFTQLGVRVTNCLAEAAEAAAVTDVTVCLPQVTPLLMHADVEAVFKFLYTLAGQVKAHGAVGHYHLDPQSHDREVVLKLMPVFDATVDRDDAGDLRVRQQ